MQPAHTPTQRRRPRPSSRTRHAVALFVAVALTACSNELAVPTEPLRLLRADWGVAYVGEAFDAALRPAGGLRPYRFELADGPLPPGLALASGRIVGTPTEVGRFEFTISVQDGNLSQALQELAIDVRALPTPVIRVDAPATELRGEVPLVVRLEDARGWRGARIALSWDPTAFALVGEPTAGDARLALLHAASEGNLLLEIAALGDARSGASNLARFTLQAIEAPKRLGLEVTAASRYTGGEHVATRSEGARSERRPQNPAQPTTPEGVTPNPTVPAEGAGTEEEVSP